MIMEEAEIFPCDLRRGLSEYAQTIFQARAR
jgi:hypothetical protein